MVLVPRKRWRVLLAALADLAIELPVWECALAPGNIAILDRFFLLAVLEDRLPLALHLILVFELDLLVSLAHLIIN